MEWVLIVLGIIISLIPTKEREKEWGSDPLYLKPKRQIKRKQKIPLGAKLKRKSVIFNFLFSDKKIK